MDKSKLKNNISDAFFIGLLTAYAYFIAFTFQSGYYDYFNVPNFLIEVSLTNILISIISIFGFILMFYFIIDGLTACIPNDTNQYIVKIIKKYIYRFMIFIILIILDTTGSVKLYYVYFGTLLLMALVDFIKPLFSQKNIKGFKNKLIAEHKYREDTKKNEYDYKHSVNYFFLKHFPFILYFLFIIFITWTLSYQLGHFSAKNQKTFTLINDDNLVILGTYDNNLIVSEVNVEENTIKPYFYLVSNQEGYKYSRKAIGYLKLEKVLD